MYEPLPTYWQYIGYIAKLSSDMYARLIRFDPECNTLENQIEADKYLQKHRALSVVKRALDYRLMHHKIQTIRRGYGMFYDPETITWDIPERD